MKENEKAETKPGLPTVTLDEIVQPLFIPLRREYFEAFDSGKKDTEYRLYGKRWNERTCKVGRPVTLSLGYGKIRRLTGTVKSFEIKAVWRSEGAADFSKIYGQSARYVAEIGIAVNHE